MNWFLILFLMNPTVGSNMAVERFKTSADCISYLNTVQNRMLKVNPLTHVDGICIEDKALEASQPFNWKTLLKW